MSLFQKLAELKEEKIIQKKAVETNQKLQTLSEVTEKLDDLTSRHSKIIQLLINLGEARENTRKSLDSYKNQKQDLNNIYEDGKDIWNEQGINSVEELMTENASEPELIKFRESGRRGPLTEKNPSGETGKLFSDTTQLIDVKDELKKLLPEDLQKLSFSSVKSKETGITNREESINLINAYLETLNAEIETLKNHKETLYIETPEGKRETILKCQQPEFNYVKLDNPIDFRIPTQLIELSHKVGAESIKEICSEQLSKRLTKEAWSYKVEPKNQQAIDNYTELAKLEKLHEVRKDFNLAEQARQNALNHLEAIFSKPKIYQQLDSYGIYGGVLDDELRKYNGWSRARVMADRYLDYMQERTKDHSNFDSYRGPYSQLVTLFNENINRRDSRYNLERIDNPDHIKVSFNNFQKFYEFITKQTNEHTGFIGHLNSPSEVQTILKNPDTRKEIGFIEGKDAPERFLKVTSSFIKENGGLDKTRINAEAKNAEWEKRKESINKISQAAVDLRWAEQYNLNLQNTNPDTFKELTKLEELITNLKLAADAEKRLPVAKFATRKVKIESEGYHLSTLIDLTPGESYRTYIQEMGAIKEEQEEYLKPEMVELDKEINTLQKKIIIWKKEEQIAPLRRRYDFFKGCLDGQYTVDLNQASKVLLPDQLAKIQYLENKKKETSNKHTKANTIANEFQKAFGRTGFTINIDKNDPLFGKEFTVEGLFTAIKNRQMETEAVLYNLPDDKKAIWDENKRSLAEVASADEKYKQTLKENASATR